MDSEVISKYRKVMNENIFSCIELTRSPYGDIMLMPINRFYDFLKWKSKLEEEKQKQMEEEFKNVGKA